MSGSSEITGIYCSHISILRVYKSIHKYYNEIYKDHYPITEEEDNTKRINEFEIGAKYDKLHDISIDDDEILPVLDILWDIWNKGKKGRNKNIHRALNALSSDYYIRGSYVMFLIILGYRIKKLRIKCIFDQHDINRVMRYVDNDTRERLSEIKKYYPIESCVQTTHIMNIVLCRLGYENINGFINKHTMFMCKFGSVNLNCKYMDDREITILYLFPPSHNVNGIKDEVHRRCKSGIFTKKIPDVIDSMIIDNIPIDPKSMYKLLKIAKLNISRVVNMNTTHCSEYRISIGNIVELYKKYR
jgi:hypothetical protein